MISVLWQLCIRLIWHLSVRCVTRKHIQYHNIHRKTENILFVKFIIFKINFNVIFNIYYFFIIYILSYNPSSIPKHNPNTNLCRPLYLNRNMIWPFLAVRSAHKSMFNTFTILVRALIPHMCSQTCILI